MTARDSPLYLCLALAAPHFHLLRHTVQLCLLAVLNLGALGLGYRRGGDPCETHDLRRLHVVCAISVCLIVHDALDSPEVVVILWAKSHVYPGAKMNSPPSCVSLPGSAIGNLNSAFLYQPQPNDNPADSPPCRAAADRGQSAGGIPPAP